MGLWVTLAGNGGVFELEETEMSTDEGKYIYYPIHCKHSTMELFHDMGNSNRFMTLIPQHKLNSNNWLINFS